MAAPDLAHVRREREEIQPRHGLVQPSRGEAKVRSFPLARVAIQTGTGFLEITRMKSKSDFSADGESILLTPGSWLVAGDCEVDGHSEH